MSAAVVVAHGSERRQGAQRLVLELWASKEARELVMPTRRWWSGFLLILGSEVEIEIGFVGRCRLLGLAFRCVGACSGFATKADESVEMCYRSRSLPCLRAGTSPDSDKWIKGCFWWGWRVSLFTRGVLPVLKIVEYPSIWRATRLD